MPRRRVPEPNTDELLEAFNSFVIEHIANLDQLREKYESRGEHRLRKDYNNRTLARQGVYLSRRVTNTPGVMPDEVCSALNLQPGTSYTRGAEKALALCRLLRIIEETYKLEKLQAEYQQATETSENTKT
jgi:hypothetical protein